MCSSIHEAYRAKSTAVLDCAEQVGVLYKIAKYDLKAFVACGGMQACQTILKTVKILEQSTENVELLCVVART